MPTPSKRKSPSTKDAPVSIEVISKKRSLPLSKLTASRSRRNRVRDYPLEVRLKKPGPARKFYRNARHVDMQAQIDLQRQAGLTFDVTRDELALARSIIPKERFMEEPELIGLAFVPYRYWSAWQRTEAFAKEFDRIYREYQLSDFAKTIPAPPRACLSQWPDSDINALWRARQYADSLGVPYSFYIRQAFKYRFATGYKRCPKPGQLWHGDKILNHIRNEFKAQGGNAARREYDTAVLHPMLLVENYRDDAIQQAAHADLRLKAKMFPDSFKLGDMLQGSRIITEEAARHHFGDSAVERVKEDYRPFKIREPAAPLTEAQRPMPGCFGTHEATATDCPTCPVRVECRALQARVDAMILAEHGSTDPVKAARTKAATLRKQRQRVRGRLDREAVASEGTDRRIDVEPEASSNDGPRPKP